MPEKFRALSGLTRSTCSETNVYVRKYLRRSATSPQGKTNLVVVFLSFASWYPSTDAVSLAYVLGDTVDKGYKDYSEGKGMTAVGKISLDVLLWQTLASVAVPGLTINLTVSVRVLLRTCFFLVLFPRFLRSLLLLLWLLLLSSCTVGCFHHSLLDVFVSSTHSRHA